MIDSRHIITNREKTKFMYYTSEGYTSTRDLERAEKFETRDEAVRFRNENIEGLKMCLGTNLDPVVLPWEDRPLYMLDAIEEAADTKQRVPVRQEQPLNIDALLYSSERLVHRLNEERAIFRARLGHVQAAIADLLHYLELSEHPKRREATNLLCELLRMRRSLKDGIAKVDVIYRRLLKGETNATHMEPEDREYQPRCLSELFSTGDVPTLAAYMKLYDSDTRQTAPEAQGGTKREKADKYAGDAGAGTQEDENEWDD